MQLEGVYAKAQNIVHNVGLQGSNWWDGAKLSHSFVWWCEAVLLTMLLQEATMFHHSYQTHIYHRIFQLHVIYCMNIE